MAVQYRQSISVPTEKGEPMDKHTATEMAYKNGYAKGYADAMQYATEELKVIAQDVKQIDEVMHKILTILPEPPKGE